MRSQVIVDAGPLATYLNRSEQFHEWTVAQFSGIEPPLLTCEAVVSEACFLARRTTGGPVDIVRLLEKGVLEIAFDLQSERQKILDLMTRYSDVPMSLADGCLVRMAELHPGSRVFTLDGDFRRYRKNRRQKIPLIIPDGR